jgi:hypothetical protein
MDDKGGESGYGGVHQSSQKRHRTGKDEKKKDAQICPVMMI